jgi:hypothetical protein
VAYHHKIDGILYKTLVDSKPGTFWIRNPGPNTGIIRQIDPFRRNQIDHTKGREYVRPFWIRNLGPTNEIIRQIEPFRRTQIDPSIELNHDADCCVNPRTHRTILEVSGSDGDESVCREE